MTTIKKTDEYSEIKIGNLYKLCQDYHLCDLNGVRKKINKNSIGILLEFKRLQKYKRDKFYTYKILIDDSVRIINMQTKYQFINSTVKHIKTK